ncbi:aspartyl-phosphate phosphatase Spo0E family protein [Tepidibacillus infernus]|uniref:aspartyl-phosphate phosphatase Spo0E family protein n=1 Tax=Tepidibacillus infernus TaxID=1806172 RepID=UPI003B6E0D65
MRKKIFLLTLFKRILLIRINYLGMKVEKYFDQEKSFTHPKVYKLSAKLDKYIVLFQKIKQ